ncbi:MAG TPA: FAD-dependent oxidoreductase [Terriglobales bacterium]|jgi:glycine oxidase|nr:FAD-dependent oxidoreductase [Terriglobales bacterium]
MGDVKSWDAIIVGAGIIGLSLAIELRKRGLQVLILDRGEPGREASWAAGGMLVGSESETLPALQSLAAASARMYPEFVHELRDESGLKIDLRSDGTLLWESDAHARRPAWHPLPAPLPDLEPNLPAAALETEPLFLREQCVDPRDLVTAAVKAARHRGVDFSSGDQVISIDIDGGRVTGIHTNKTSFSSGTVINCAGAWAGQIGPHAFPTRPVKGQMLCVVMPEKNFLRHVIRTPDVYLIPRSNGRLLIGATVEESGFDKQTVPETIQKLRSEALKLMPRLSEARILEAWAGLRPGTPDKLPILGTTPTMGYFVATGHFRDGILLAPITAKVMANVVTGSTPILDLSAFSAARFG